MEDQSSSDARTVDASAEELAAWEKYKQETKIAEIPIPYAFVSGGVNVAGVFYLKDPVEESYTDGAAIGAIVGVYHLDKNKATTKLYDPTGFTLRLDFELNLSSGTLKARICNRKFNGKWNCSGWSVIASW